MKRDMVLIRRILLAVEEGHASDEIEGYDADTIKYHQALLVEAKLVEGKSLKYMDNATEVPSQVFISKLTWEGHEFIDLMKKSDVWNTIQSEFKDESFGTIIKVAKDLAEGWAKKRVKELLGDNFSK